MSAAILQGVPVTTLDTDIWIELPERQFVQLYALIKDQGGTMLAPTVAALADDSLLNFLPRIDGIGEFSKELKNAVIVKWQGLKIPALPLRRIIKSKEFIRRPKDLAHLPLLKQILKLQNSATRQKKRAANKAA